MKYQRKLYIVLSLLLLASCGVRKKNMSLNSPTYNTSATNTKTSSNVMSKYADILGVSTKSLNADLYAVIDQWIGIRHQLGGQTKEGIDCSAFVGLLYREVYHKDLPRTSRDMADIVQRKYDNQLAEGDLVFFSFGGNAIDHVGIYLHNDRFIHVSTSKGVMISNLKEAWYYKYLSRCGTPRL